MNNLYTTQRNGAGEQGFALILALIISSVVLAIGLGLLDLTIKQLNIGTTARQSEIAFQAAAAGLDCIQRIRNKYPATVTGGNILVDCFDHTFTLTDKNGSPDIQHYQIDYSPTITGFDWNPSTTNPRCIDIDFYVLNASGGAPVSHTINGQARTCAANGVCTFAFSRGYNRACAATSDLFTVQRELTAEF